MKTPMTLMSPTIKFLILAVLASLAAWQLYTGRARTRGWRLVTSDDNPIAYWLIVISEVVLFFVVLYGN